MDKNKLKYSAKYFSKTTKIVKNNIPKSIVTLQFFQRKNGSLLCGINEVINLLKKETDYKKYKIKYLSEGSIVNNKQIVLELEGPYQLFGQYEGIIDGILARQTSIATNAKKITDATNKNVVYMGDRADHYRNQAGDGYAASIGGISTQVTDAQVSLHKGLAVGTMPHALIQMFKGDLVKALSAYQKAFPKENLTALVDFNNDVVGDSLKALKVFGKKLYAVRVDTSMGVSDVMFKNDEEHGVTPNMVKAVRKALDKEKGKHVKIIVSSGFNEEKIKHFEEMNAPVDIYGVGASILKINIQFTADAVKIDGEKYAKIGRIYREMKDYKEVK